MFKIKKWILQYLKWFFNWLWEKQGETPEEFQKIRDYAVPLNKVRYGLASKRYRRL